MVGEVPLMFLCYNHIMNIMIDFMTLFLHLTLGHHHVSIIQAGKGESPRRQPSVVGA